jgi:molybdate transport system ATP-binding protein
MNSAGVALAGALQVEIEQSSPMRLSGGFTCQPGELLALVGPSGAGKTSMLRCLAGLMHASQGRISVGGEVWFDAAAKINLPPQQRHVGLVFQDYALMPHLSAIDNVALSLLHLNTSQRRERAAHWLSHVLLSAPEQMRRPADLSGGQKQRVAVARALAREPRLLLLDEPFSAVDQMSRQGLYALLADLRKDLAIPIVLVTHDLAEARQLADSLVVIDAGMVLQQGAPAHIYRSPRNARVADLLGVQNRFQGEWMGPRDDLDRQEQRGWLRWLGDDASRSELLLRVRDKGKLPVGQRVTWVIQGDGLRLSNEPITPARDAACVIPVQTRLTEVRHLGETTLAVAQLLQLPSCSLKLTRSGPMRQQLAAEQELSIALDCDWVHVMPVR